MLNRPQFVWCVPQRVAGVHRSFSAQKATRATNFPFDMWSSCACVRMECKRLDSKWSQCKATTSPSGIAHRYIWSAMCYQTFMVPSASPALLPGCARTDQFGHHVTIRCQKQHYSIYGSCYMDDPNIDICVWQVRAENQMVMAAEKHLQPRLPK